MIFEHARFNKRNQLPEKPVDQFISEIHRLADRCDFKNMKDELIRDRLLVRIRDNALSEWLQMEPELTLDKAKRLIRQREAMKEQQETIRNPKKEGLVDSLARQGPRRNYQLYQQQQTYALPKCVDIVGKILIPGICAQLRKLNAAAAIGVAISAASVCRLL